MNDTRNSSTHTLPDKTAEAMAVPVLMFAVGVIGNIIAIAALSGSKQERKSSAFFALVCGLAVTDLLGTCLASPITIATYLNENVLYDNTDLCEFHSFLLLFFGVAGLSIICAMSAERYLAICCPYTYQRWGIDQHFARKCLFCIYLSNIAFCCLPVMGMAGSICQPSKTWCFINWRADKTLPATYSFLYASVSFLLILMTIVLNFVVCGTLLIMRRRKIQSPVTRGSTRARWRALSSGVEAQMMTVLMVTSVVVLGCSAPLVVRVFSNQITWAENSHADLMAIRIASVNAILDPWIYILLRRTLFRKIQRFSKVFYSSRKGKAPMLPVKSSQRTFHYQGDITNTHVFTPL
ncbi:prostaglandin E2 receptor EP4 subtype-like [Salvelinus alpinus]|uniref:prostaglandin E2 receptor EP4 subtype-like n=1 Tax=Salvelinus sp. IW2-2015 TaxID=2691554 RepID=UPI000CDFCEE7|nr:prostaglandin E2 receptor EP4 subtype-like [Salvelinus alpinus]